MAPSTMKAAIFKGGSNPVSVEAVPIPTAVPGSAVIKVLANDIPPAYLFIASGEAGMPPPPPPFTLSSQSIGRIHAVAPDATTLQPGQLVYFDFHLVSRDDPDTSILQGYQHTPTPGGDRLAAAWNEGSGTVAEYARCPLENLYPLNEELLVGELGYTFPELSTIGNAMISSSALVGVLDTKPGDTVIVAPATGRYGAATVQLGLALGLRVIAGGRSEDKLASLVRGFPEAGRRLVTVRFTGDLQADTGALLAAAGGAGADAYSDWSPPQAEGSTHIAACVSALRPGGKVCLMGGVGGVLQTPMIEFLIKGLRVEGRNMFTRREALQVVKMVEAGVLKLGRQGVKEFNVKGGFKVDDIHRALDASNEIGSWAHMVAVEP